MDGPLVGASEEGLVAQQSTGLPPIGKGRTGKKEGGAAAGGREGECERLSMGEERKNGRKEGGREGRRRRSTQQKKKVPCLSPTDSDCPALLPAIILGERREDGFWEDAKGE